MRLGALVQPAAPLFAAALVIALIAAAPAAAATYTVTDLGDSGVAGDGSLRGEIRAANAHEGADTIAFAPGLSGTLTISGSGLVIQGPTAIEGPGPGAVSVRQISGGHRVIQVKLTEPGAVSIAGLTLAGGETTGPGGDLEFDAEGEPGSLEVVDCVITEGSAEDYGGGLSSFGAPLTLRDSAVVENEGDSGGGIWAGGHDMPFTIEGSTIADNESVSAGGGLNGEVEHGGHDAIVDSTFAGNKSEDEGGGAYFSLGSETSITVANSTVTENIADGGGGGFEFNTDEGVQATVEDSTIAGNHGGSLLGEAGGVQESGAVPQAMVDTIVADNTGGQPDIFGEWAASFSLIGNPSGAKISEALPGSDLVGVEPNLAPLAANGGPTETMMPAASSPVINKGGGSLATDQRGDPRPSIFPGVALSGAPGADGADIGAVELQAPAVASTPSTSGAGAKSGPRVKVRCPKRAGHGGCRFLLRAVSAKPRRTKGRGGHVRLIRPKPESAAVRIRLKAGRSTILTLTPKPRFAAKLDRARQILVREVETIGDATHTTYRRLKVIG
ncbi:MAG: choice-of-anchor Q domain-containing protein [Solirubrobacterales bacterium]